MALLHPVVQRLPVTPAIVYLVVGAALGPLWANALKVSPIADARWVERGVEFAVIISLFTVGLKLRLPVWSRELLPAICLATISMALTVGLITVTGVFLLGLPWAAALLLGGILAPTDPVLASDVQVRHARDRDKVRLALSVEAGLNDGAAFPFVVLGLALLAGTDVGVGGWRWWAHDVFWAIGAGLVVGWFLGYGLGKLMLRFQMRRKTPVAFGEYLVLGLIAVSYGAALAIDGYGFLAVFAAGVALRAVERQASPSGRKFDRLVEQAGDPTPSSALAANPHTAPAYFAGALLATNEQVEHLLEMAVVLLTGAMLFVLPIPAAAWGFGLLLFLVIRPLSALPVLATGKFSVGEFAALGWFGIRGVGSIYYVMYALRHGLPSEIAETLVALTLSVVALSIVVHGTSVTPLLRRLQPPKTRGKLRT